MFRSSWNSRTPSIRHATSGSAILELQTCSGQGEACPSAGAGGPTLAFDDAQFDLETLGYADGHTGLKALIQPMRDLRDALGVPAREKVCA